MKETLYMIGIISNMIMGAIGIETKKWSVLYISSVGIVFCLAELYLR